MVFLTFPVSSQESLQPTYRSLKQGGHEFTFVSCRLRGRTRHGRRLAGKRRHLPDRLFIQVAALQLLLQRRGPHRSPIHTGERDTKGIIDLPDSCANNRKVNSTTKTVPNVARMALRLSLI